MTTTNCNWNESYTIDLLNDTNRRLVSYCFDDKETAKNFIRRQQARHNWKFALIERKCGLWTRVLLYRDENESSNRR